MEVKDIITIIPELFTYIIPGYIYVILKRKFRSEKEGKDFHDVIISIIMSFIINYLLNGIILLVNSNFKKNIELSTDLRNIFLIIISILVAVLMSYYYESKLEVLVNSIFKSNIVSGSNVWNKAMKSEDGAWVNVYIYEADIVYCGKLKYYTINPEDSNREILLTSYQSKRISSGEEIESYNDSKKTVLINCNNITNIEVLHD